LGERNIRINIQYDGTEFAGWQRQPDLLTIQGEIERAITDLTSRKITLYGAGRTDAGVHALEQVANFRVDFNLPSEKFREALNYYLPRTILITRSAEVPDNFDARRSAIWRHYRYIVGKDKSALYFNRRWEFGNPLNIGRMNRMAALIQGQMDCSTFCTVASLKENNDCEIISAGWREDEDVICFEIKANRFLHSMVRSIVGLMIEGGREKDYLTLENFKDIIKSGDHTRIKLVAPARGLYLVSVGY